MAEKKDAAPKTKPGITPAMMVIVAFVLALLVGMIQIIQIELIASGSTDPIKARWFFTLLQALQFILGFGSILLLLVGAVRWAIFGHTGKPSTHVEATIERLDSIRDRLVLSETAKRIAFRREDLALLRKTIQEDMQKGDSEAALVLVNELSETYGYAEEAEQLLEQIEAARTAEIEAKVDAALEELDKILEQRDFAKAAKEAGKIQRLYSQSDRVKDVSRRVIEAREAYKHELEREFLKAKEREDIDKAMELLKKLDTYLTPGDAEPFREIARDVIGKKRDNLGVQFKMAV
ncbi:MAG: hypothetical protein MI741_03845, partial [Rhodospirillales bacterium]|nr:hypothetical protein [Rhodospirillales bacterium]